MRTNGETYLMEFSSKCWKVLCGYLSRGFRPFLMINHHLLLGFLPSGTKIDQYCNYIGMFRSLCEPYKGLVCTNIKQITVVLLDLNRNKSILLQDFCVGMI